MTTLRYTAETYDKERDQKKALLPSIYTLPIHAQTALRKFDYPSRGFQKLWGDICSNRNQSNGLRHLIYIGYAATRRDEDGMWVHLTENGAYVLMRHLAKRYRKFNRRHNLTAK